MYVASILTNATCGNLVKIMDNVKTVQTTIFAIAKGLVSCYTNVQNTKKLSEVIILISKNYKVGHSI